MAIYKRIKELQARIKTLESEPVTHWLGKWAKSAKMHILEKKIASLRKELKPNPRPKQHKFDHDVQ